MNSQEERFPGLVCGCGSEDFERVVVERDGRPPHRTILAECLHCHAAFVVPPAKPSVREQHAKTIQGVRDAAKGGRTPTRPWGAGQSRKDGPR